MTKVHNHGIEVGSQEGRELIQEIEKDVIDQQYMDQVVDCFCEDVLQMQLKKG